MLTTFSSFICGCVAYVCHFLLSQPVNKDVEGATPEDGEGEGRVVAWRTSADQVRGEPAPSLCGWVRVEWLVTGYQKCYRLGVGTDVTFARDCDLVVATEDKIDLAEVQKGELQLKHMRCTFGYRSGVRFPHYAKFDIRKEAMEKVAAFQHGDTVEHQTEAGAVRSVCIGVKYDPDDRQVKMWFHSDGKDGAGLYHGIDLERDLTIVARNRVGEARRDELEAASDGEIEHDDREWVRQNLQPSLTYKSLAGQTLRVDTSAAKIAKFKVKFKSGDVIQDAVDHERMTCIGVAVNPSRACAELWFHVQGAPGAGVSRGLHKSLSRYTVISNHPVQQGEIEETPAEKMAAVLEALNGNLECTFHFPTGSIGHDAKYDVRQDVVKKVTGWVPGTVLSVDGHADMKLTLVGIRPDDKGAPAVWWHIEDAGVCHAGARIVPNLEGVDLKDTGRPTSEKALALVACLLSVMQVATPDLWCKISLVFSCP